MKINMTVPEYFRKFIDKSVDLNSTTKICCPFHNEDTPSFSYKPETGRWRCFGACKTGGDVIDLHRMNYKFKSREVAYSHLCKCLGYKPEDINSLSLGEYAERVNEMEVAVNKLYYSALVHAKDDVDKFVELTQVMTVYPVDMVRLKQLLNKWEVKYDE